MVTRYVPDAGDLIWLTGERPALVLSPRSYNTATGLAVMCPVTSKQKGEPVSGAILSGHLKSLDWRARKATFVTTAPTTVLAEVRARVKPLLGV